MTILFSLCYLDEPGRLERNKEYLTYNLSIQKELGFNRIVLLDNASDMANLKQLDANIYDENKVLLYSPTAPSIIDIYRFTEHLPRTGTWEYPYCWRGLDYLKTLLPTCEKVVALDSDFYILSHRLADYVKELDSGWVSFFNHKYGFPEAAIHILCKDQFHKVLDFPIPSYTHYNNQHMEWLLPFTQVHKEGFKGDRYGENCLQQTDDMDYYGQWSVGCPKMRFK